MPEVASPRKIDGIASAAVVFAPLASMFLVLGVAQSLRPLLLTSLWGLLVLVSFVGWGGAFRRLAYGNERPGWSLDAAWGMAIAIFVGGVLCSASLISPATMLLFVLIGLALYSWDVRGIATSVWLSRPWARWRSIPIASVLVGAALLLFLGLQYVGAISEFRLNLGDDLLAYSSWPRRMLQTGSLIDPFSVRRMSAFGGQTFLQAFTLLAGLERNLNLFDAGLCVIVMCGLVHHELRRLRPRLGWVVLIPLVFIVMLPGRRFNLGGWISGAVFLFAAFRLMRWQPFAGQRGGANAVAMALLMSALCTLRNSYITVAVLLMAAAYLSLLFTSDRTPSRRWSTIREMLLVGVGTILMVAPWMIAAWRSNRSFLFPLMKGYYNPDYLLFAGSLKEVTGLVRAKAIWANIHYCEPIKTLPLFLVPALVLTDNSERKALRAAVLAALLGFFAVVWGFPASDPFSNERYTFAALLPAVLATIIVALETLSDEGRRRQPVQLGAAVLAVVALLMQIHDARATAEKTYTTHLENIWQAAADKRQPLLGAEYQAMQQRVPAGVPIVAMVDDPHYFDYSRNRILLLDLPGAASLPPGLPILKGRQAISDYFRSLGFRYLAFVRPTASKESYARRHWLGQSKQMPWKLVMPFYTAIFDYVEVVAEEQKLLYDDGRMILVDLEEAAPESPPLEPMTPDTEDPSPSLGQDQPEAD